MNTLSANFRKIFENVNEDINDVKSKIPLSTSQLVNDSNFVTEAVLSDKQDKITSENKLAYDLISGAPAGGGEWGSISGTLSAQTDLQNALDEKATTTALEDHETDLMVHVTEEDRNNWDGKADATELENYVPYTQYNDDIGLIQQDITEKQDIIDSENKLDWDYIDNAPTIPSSTSQLTNDSNFITESALSGKQDKITAQSKLDYVLLSGTPTIPTKTSDLTNDSGFATSAYVQSEVSGKADKGELSSKQDLITNENKLAYDLISGVPASQDVAWGSITGALSAQTDLNEALEAKADADDIPLSTSQLVNDSNFANVVFQPIIEQNGNGSLFAANYGMNAAIIKYVGAAASGAVTIFATGENNIPSGHVATIELQVPVSGEVTTITIPSAFQQINIPEKLEATSEKITYHDFVFRAEKDSIAGTMRQCVNYAYSFTEDMPEPPPTITFNNQTMSFNSNTADNIQLSYTDSAVGETVSAEIEDGYYPSNFYLDGDHITFDGYATSSGSYPIIVKLSSEGTPKGVSAVVTLNVTMNQVTMPATQSASMDDENTWFTPDYSGTPEWPNSPTMTILSGTVPTGVEVSTEGDFGFGFYPESTVHETQTLAVQISDGDGTSLPASGLVTLICDYDAPTYQLTMTSPQQGTIMSDGDTMMLDYGGDPEFPEFIPNMTVLSGSLPEGVEVVEGEPTFQFTAPDPTQDVMDSSTVIVQLTDPNGEWLPCSGIVEISVEYYAPQEDEPPEEEPEP